MVAVEKRQRVADCEEEPGAHGDSLPEHLLARGPAIVVEPDQEHYLRFKAHGVTNKVAQGSIPSHYLQQHGELVLGDIVETVPRSLVGDPPGKAAPNEDPDKILRAVNWIRVFVPALASVICPLQALVDELMAGTRRTKRVASNRGIHEEDWTVERDTWGEVAKVTGDRIYVQASAYIQGAAKRGPPPAGRRSASRTRGTMSSRRRLP